MAWVLPRAVPESSRVDFFCMGFTSFSSSSILWDTNLFRLPAGVNSNDYRHLAISQNGSKLNMSTRSNPLSIWEDDRMTLSSKNRWFFGWCSNFSVPPISICYLSDVSNVYSWIDILIWYATVKTCAIFLWKGMVDPPFIGVDTPIQTNPRWDERTQHGDRYSYYHPISLWFLCFPIDPHIPMTICSLTVLNQKYGLIWTGVGKCPILGILDITL